MHVTNNDKFIADKRKNKSKKYWADDEGQALAGGADGARGRSRESAGKGTCLQ
jgi:hypothetical protein